MGVYDSVWVKCPKCETKNEFQTKSGECLFRKLYLRKLP